MTTIELQLHNGMQSNHGCSYCSYETSQLSVVTFCSFIETKVIVNITILHVTVDNALCHSDNIIICELSNQMHSCDNKLLLL